MHSDPFDDAQGFFDGLSVITGIAADELKKLATVRGGGRALPDNATPAEPIPPAAADGRRGE